MYAGRYHHLGDDAAARSESAGAPMILQVIASSRGGGAVHVRELAVGLTQAGLSVVVLMGEDHGHVEAGDFAGVRCVGWPGAPLHLLRSAGSLVAVLRRERPLLVHAHGARAAFATYVALGVVGSHTTPLVWSVHGYVTPFHARPRRWLQAGVERLIARRADAIVAVSLAERAELMAQGLAPDSKIVCVRNGLDLTAFAALTPADTARARTQLGVPHDALVVATVCRLERPRDFDTLLRAFRLVVDRLPEAKLLVAGDGPLRPGIIRLINALSLQESVCLLGFRRDPVTVYAAADLCVLTSNGWEGFALACVEAQAAGVPMIATDVGGARETIQPGTTGLLVPPSDPGALAVAALRMLSDAPRRAHLGTTGRAHALVHCQREPMLDGMRAVYAAAMRSAR